MKQGLKLKLALKNDVINGFSYSFTSSLLKALKKHRAEMTIFLADEDNIAKNYDYSDDDNDDEYQGGYSCDYWISDVVTSVIRYLTEQLYFDCDHQGMNHSASIAYVDGLIKHATDFLAIFQE